MQVKYSIKISEAKRSKPALLHYVPSLHPLIIRLLLVPTQRVTIWILMTVSEGLEKGLVPVAFILLRGRLCLTLPPEAVFDPMTTSIG
jgi:hypothetical protein